MIIRELAQSSLLAAIRNDLDAGQVLQTAIAVQQIPAPTFAEDRRAVFVQRQFEQYGLQNLMLDALSNVYGCWPGQDATLPALMVSAHIDTVFAVDVDLSIRREDDRLYGPGLGDNSLGVAGLLALLDIFQKYRIVPRCDIWFVANSREEGLGNLDGIRAVWQALGARLGAAIVIEGMALGRIYHAGIAVRRLHITCHSPGGHSWLNFGQPSAVHGLIELGARIIGLTPPINPRTTFNIGLINGGHSVNSLATSADLYLDLRSEAPDSLHQLEQEILSTIDIVRRPGVDFVIEVVGDRPAGRISVDHPLTQLAADALDIVNIAPIYESGSTDANLLLANGLPAVTVGISHGGHAHRLDEFIETAPITDGIWQLLLLILAASEQMSSLS